MRADYHSALLLWDACQVCGVRFGHIFGLTLSTAPSAQMASGVFLNRILLSNEPKKLFINSRFIFLILWLY